MNKKGGLEDLVDIAGAILILFIVGLLVSIPFRVGSQEQKQNMELDIAKIKATRALNVFLLDEHQDKTNAELLQNNDAVSEAKFNLQAESFFKDVAYDGFILQITKPEQKTQTLNYFSTGLSSTTLSTLYLPYARKGVITIVYQGTTKELHEKDLKELQETARLSHPGKT